MDNCRHNLKTSPFMSTARQSSMTFPIHSVWISAADQDVAAWEAWPARQSQRYGFTGGVPKRAPTFASTTANARINFPRRFCMQGITCRGSHRGSWKPSNYVCIYVFVLSPACQRESKIISSHCTESIAQNICMYLYATIWMHKITWNNILIVSINVFACQIYNLFICELKLKLHQICKINTSRITEDMPKIPVVGIGLSVNNACALNNCLANLLELEATVPILKRTTTGLLHNAPASIHAMIELWNRI